MSEEVQTPTAGGKATAAGMSYQSRVAAYYAVAILTERNAEPPLHLPADATFEYVRCETGEPVDDVLIGISTGGHIFGQAKRTLGLSPGKASPLHSVADQFVRQYLSNRDQKRPVPPWTAPLDPAKDRLVAIVGPRSPDTVTTALANVLDSVRELHSAQPLEQAASNAAERGALSTFIDHLSSSWMDATGAAPSDADIRLVASLSYVSLLAVEEDEINEQQAKERLRTSVLANPADAQAAWRCLVEYTLALGKTGGGADRPTLQQVLIDAGFELQTPRSYRDDVLRLTDATASALELISGLANITVGHKTVHLPRASSDYLCKAALQGSLLVVGDPGSGKSGCLYDLCATARQKGTDVVLLLVDRLASSADPFKDELGITHPLADVLRSWPGDGPALLVLDALDAARDEQVSRKIRDVITVVRAADKTRWRVVASIRKFDLRNSDELARLFRREGPPPAEYFDRDFRSVAHMDVPPLTDDELKDLCAASPELDTLWTAATTEFRELLRVPFNMRLAADLVGDGVAVSTLGLVRTQLDLLDRYWAARVIGDDRRDEERERVLREVCERLVSGRTLQTDRALLTSSSRGLLELLSRNVLAEWRASPSAHANRYRVGFSHHVLFDYAVSRLLMRGSPESLLARLKDAPDFFLVARPSLSLHFRHLWATDRPAFWDLSFRLIGDKRVPRIAGLIGPGVAADSARDIEDLAPLAGALKGPADVEVAKDALRHVVGSLLTLHIDVAGSEAGPWCQFANDIADGLPSPAVGSLRVLIALAADSSAKLTPSQATSLNNASRVLLRYAWTSEPANHFLSGIALQAICRTFSGNPSESAAALRKAVESSHLVDHGYGELNWIARELEPLIALDPGMVSDIYCAAFSYLDTSDTPTQLGGGPLISLSSRRRQDYKTAWWQMAHDVPHFLREAPADATRAVLVSLHEHLKRERDLDRFASDPSKDTFSVRGSSVLYRVDHSALWDADSTRVHDEPVMMLGELDQFLREVSDEQESVRFDTVVSAILRGPHSAVIWRRILQAAKESGGHLGTLAKDLCLAGPVLGGTDTSHAVGEFLSARFHEFSAAEREAIERAILGLPQPSERVADERAERIRARLLGCLPEEDIVTEEVRALLRSLRATDAVPNNVPPFQFTSMRGGPLTTDDWLAHLGVPVSESPNRHLIELMDPIKDFGRTSGSQLPTQEDLHGILPHLAALRSALNLAAPEGAHSEAINAAWGYIAGACNRAAQMEGISSSVEPGLTLRTLLLEASATARPGFDPEAEAQFDRVASWGSPAARIDAAAGLLTVVRNDLAPPDEVLAALRRLREDPVSAVRYQVAVHVLYLFQHCPSFVWDLIGEALVKERSQTVLKAWIHSLARLSSSDANRVAALLLDALTRTDQNPISRESRDAAIVVVMQLFVFRNHDDSGRWVRQTLDHTSESPADAQALVPSLHEGLIYGSNEPEDNGIRRRAIDLGADLVRRSIAGLHSLEDQQRTSGAREWPDDARQRAEALAAISGSVTGQVYIATGTFELTHPQQSPKRQGPSPEIRKRFYSEASTLLDEMPHIGLVPAAHQMIEILGTFVSEDPRGVFLRIATAVQAGSRRGYASESLAADLVVRIVKRYLADYRGLLRDDDRCRALLIETLDLFVDAGWPSARELTYKLEDIFR